VSLVIILGDRIVCAATGLTGDLFATAGAEAGDAKEAKNGLGGTNRGVRGNILGDTSSITNLAVEFVLIDAVGGCGLADVAGTAGEHELICDAVLLGVEKVGAMTRLV
jgi:hypothetical protein